MNRRKRSTMTEADCLEALRAFSGKVRRHAETSASAFHEELPRERLTVAFEIEGNFGDGDDLFEAIRVMSGRKLPAL